MILIPSHVARSRRTTNPVDDRWEAVYGCYWMKLVTEARSVLVRQGGRSADAEDAAQDAVISVWRAVKTGRLQFNGTPVELWSLLRQKTRWRAVQYCQRDRRQKRGGGRVFCGSTCQSGGPSGSSVALEQRASRSPAPDQVVLDADWLDYLFAQRQDRIARRIVLLKRDGCTTREIAHRLGCARSTVVRKIAALRDRAHRARRSESQSCH